MISAKTAAKLRKILQATATGSTVQAAARYGVRRQAVDAVIDKYAKMARSILGEEV